MAIRTYKVTLDTKNTIAPEPVFLRQGDKTGAVVIDAILMDNGVPVSLSGLTPMFKANTADGQAVIIDSTGFNIIDASAGEFTYQVPNALSAVPGKIVTAYFSFSDASGSESTFDVAFIIKKAVDITKPQADDYITIIDGTLQSLQQKIDAMNTDVQTILNAFNQGDFYNKAETDSKDAATLAGAKSYSDSNLAKAKEYTEDANDFVLGDGMHFVAHRGNNAEWPENSKAAFRTVTRHWGIETDISVTKDGYWVIMHDATVDRTTNGTGNIADMTFAQIQALKIDTGTNVSYLSADDLKVPTVEDYLGICKANNKTPFLEIKQATYTDANYDSLAAAINQYGMAKSMVLISFYFEALQAMKKRLPWLNTSFLTNTYSNADADKAATLGPNSGIDAGGYANITAEQVAYAHSKGLKFGLWTPTDDTNRASWQEMGVDYVTTNSKSGDLRWGAITLTGGWTANANARLAIPFVEQVNLRTAHIVLNITGGNGAKGNPVGNLPDWAVPLNDFWSPATVRTSSSITLGGIDIRGASSGSEIAGVLQAGYNLDQMPTSSIGWVNFDVTYSL